MDRKIRLKADYILPISSSPIPDGVITINNNIIEDVRSFTSSCRNKLPPHFNPPPLRGEEIGGGGKRKSCSIELSPLIDLGRAILMPGFVNCHTHLELSMLKGTLKYNGSFALWLEDLVEVKSGWNKKKYIASTKQGITELINTGTTTVADITNTGYSVEPILNSGLRGTVYKEIIEFDPEKSENVFKENTEFIESLKLDCHGLRLRRSPYDSSESIGPRNDTPVSSLRALAKQSRIRYGLSPHAPYSVSDKLLEKIAEYSSKNGTPITIHISESEEEVQFLKGGSSPLREFLEKRSALPLSWQSTGATPVSYLYGLNFLSPKTLGVHLNFLSDEDIEILNRVNMSIVHCPRSTRYFDRPPYDTSPSPIPPASGGRIKKSGLSPYKSVMTHPAGRFNIAIGTDSLASNDSLNMLDEMRLLKETLNIPADTILKMATINGAKTLGLEDKIGTLDAGKCADIIALKKVKDSTSFPALEELSESLLTDTWEVSLVIADGKILKYLH